MLKFDELIDEIYQTYGGIHNKTSVSHVQGAGTPTGFSIPGSLSAPAKNNKALGRIKIKRKKTK